MNGKVEFRSGVLRNNLAWQSRFNLLGVAVTLFFWRKHETTPLILAQFALVLLSFVQHAWVMNTRPKLRIGGATLLYFLNLILVATMLWLANAASAAIPRVWAPFESHKMSALAAPLFAPAGPGIGAVGSLLFAATAAIQYFSFGPEVRANLVEDEPWATLIFSAFGLLLCALKMWNQKLLNRELRCRVESNAMRRLNSRLHALRDLTNTPLTTAMVGSRLLRRRNPLDSTVLDRMDRALANIEEANRIQSEEESIEQYRHHLSFDARKKLKPSRRRVKLRSDL